MSHQDWNVVTFTKNKTTKKKKGGVHGPNNNSVIKSGNPNRQNKSSYNASKIEQQIEDCEYSAPKVTHNLQIQIQRARQDKKLTQKQLAQAANITESVVKSYENGKAVPSQNDIRKMSKALGINLKNK
jgi:putative transcription factor